MCMSLLQRIAFGYRSQVFPSIQMFKINVQKKSALDMIL